MKTGILIIVLLLSGCVVHVPAHRAPRSSARPPPAAPPPQSAIAPPPARQERVVRAKEIRARTIRARIIFAKEVKAGGGRIGRTYEGDHQAWRGGRGDGEIRTDVLEADVIYAKEIKADWIEAGEIHAKEVKIRR